MASEFETSCAEVRREGAVMSERDEIHALLRQMESIIDVDAFREKARRVVEIFDAASTRPDDIERALSICTCCYLPGAPPRVLEESNVMGRLVDEGLVLADSTFDGETVYDVTVPGENLVRRTLVEIHKANRAAVVS
jgi:hypothetical protein